MLSARRRWALVAIAVLAAVLSLAVSGGQLLRNSFFDHQTEWERPY